MADQLAGLPNAAGSIAAPAGAKKQPVAAAAGVPDADADLQARLENLRRE